VWRVVRAPIAALIVLGHLGAVGSPVGGVEAQRADDLRVAITAPEPGAVLQGRTLVTGWAVDPTSPDGAGVNPRDIQLWLGAPPDGYLLDYAQYGLPSPEAASIYGPRSHDSGFAMAWQTCSFPAGSHDLWAFVSSSVRPGLTDFTRIDVTVSPCPPGTVLFRADWSTLPPLTTEQTEQGPVDEGWSVRRLLPGAAGRGVEGAYGDFLVEVTAQRVGPRDGYYFLDFRALPGPGDSLTDAFYRFSVHPASGRYRLGISHPGPDPIEDIIPWTEARAIQRGTTPNRLGVEAVGPRLRLYANGELLAETSNRELRWGKIRFGAATGDDPTTEAYFRDFVISTVPAP
jgi:hypothetical protein